MAVECIDAGQVAGALEQVETRIGVETANLLRAYIRGLEGRLRVYELGDDDLANRELRIDTQAINKSSDQHPFTS